MPIDPKIHNAKQGAEALGLSGQTRMFIGGALQSASEEGRAIVVLVGGEFTNDTIKQSCVFANITPETVRDWLKAMLADVTENMADAKESYKAFERERGNH